MGQIIVGGLIEKDSEYLLVQEKKSKLLWQMEFTGRTLRYRRNCF